VAHNIDVGATAICVLPGSRRGELRKLAGVFREAAVSIVERHPDTVFVFPTVPYLKDHVTDLAKDWPGKTVVVASIAEKFDAMQSCDVAMAASGTVSLELAMGQVPHLIAYRMNRLTIKIVKMLHGMKQKYANLVNILLDREVIPEFIQERCRSDLIAAKILELLDQPAARDRQLSSIDDALSMLRPENATPSDSAATVVLSLVDSSHQPNTQEK
jgi:lipid-A-disaccharide synthase